MSYIIQLRNGEFEDLDVDKLVPSEMVIANNGRAFLNSLNGGAREVVCTDVLQEVVNDIEFDTRQVNKATKEELVAYVQRQMSDVNDSIANSNDVILEATAVINKANTTINDIVTRANKAIQDANAATAAAQNVVANKIGISNTTISDANAFSNKYVDGLIGEATETKSGLGLITLDTEPNTPFLDLSVGGNLVETLANVSLTKSPTNPATIKGVGESGSVPFNIIGNNFVKNEAVTTTINGITYTINSDKSVTANGTATADASLLIINNLTLSSGSYIFSGEPSGASASTYFMQTSVTNSELGYWLRPYNKTSFTITKQATGLVQIMVKASTTVTNLVFKPMISIASLGNIAYEPYTEQSTTLPTTTPFYSLPDGTRDYSLVRKNGVWGNLRKIGKVVFNGSSSQTFVINEPMTNANTVVSAYFTKVTDKKIGYQNIFSDKLPVTNRGALGSVECCAGEATTKFIYLCISKSRLSGWSDLLTLAEKRKLFSDFLALNPITVFYELETPIFTTYSDTIQTQLNNLLANKNVLSTDAVQPFISATVVKEDKDRLVNKGLTEITKYNQNILKQFDKDIEGSYANVNDIRSHKVDLISLLTEAEINTYLDSTVSGSLPDNYTYEKSLYFGITHSVLSGGTFYLKGFKANNQYEFQELQRYDGVSFTTLKRSKFNGVWNAWKSDVLSDNVLLQPRTYTNFTTITTNASGAANIKHSFYATGSNTYTCTVQRTEPSSDFLTSANVDKNNTVVYLHNSSGALLTNTTIQVVYTCIGY